jgi:hypothetical protein
MLRIGLSSSRSGSSRFVGLYFRCAFRLRGTGAREGARAPVSSRVFTRAPPVGCFEELPRDLQEELRKEVAGIMQMPPPPDRAPEPVQDKRPSLGLRAAAQAAIEGEMGSCEATALLTLQQVEEAAA